MSSRVFASALLALVVCVGFDANTNHAQAESNFARVANKARSASSEAEQRLIDLLNRSQASRTPVLDFLNGLNSFPNARLDSAAIRRVTAQAKIPTRGVMGILLNGVSGLEKSGKTLILTRARTAKLELEGVKVEVARRATVNVTKQGATRYLLDGFSGIKVGKGIFMVGLNRIRIWRGAEGTWAEAKASVVTRKVLITPINHQPKNPTTTTSSRRPSRGLAGALGN